ncbi:hypothetical protein EDB86DRAFT_2835420 [Lactarius hatsudake]|nr:hypothetical protein EDB86DRAFT_2835420 [Lactarius hatsudake]
MASGSRKRQAHNNCESSSEDSEVIKRLQKRQKQKGKKCTSVHIPVEVESVDKGSDKESNEPEAIELGASDPGNAGSDLEDQHQALLGEELATKSETMKDLDLMFSGWVKVNFWKSDKDTLMIGRWCLMCSGAYCLTEETQRLSKQLGSVGVF